MITCLSCGNETKNPKFCSKSCSASYNNKKFPKRKPEHKCIDCGMNAFLSKPIRSDMILMAIDECFKPRKIKTKINVVAKN